MVSFMKWLVVGWSMVIVLLWSFLSFRQWRSGQALFPTIADLWGFMGVVFLTWIIPLAVFAFFAFLARSSKPE
jgi:hypothetical protein